MTQTAERLEHTLAKLHFQAQLDQLRKDLRDLRQPRARLDSAVAKQKEAEAKGPKRTENLRHAEETLRAAQNEKAAADSVLQAAREAATPPQRRLNIVLKRHDRPAPKLSVFVFSEKLITKRECMFPVSCAWEL